MKRLWTVLALALFSFAAVSTPYAFAAEPTEQAEGDKDEKKDEKKDDKDDKKDEKKDPKKRSGI